MFSGWLSKSDRVRSRTIARVRRQVRRRGTPRKLGVEGLEGRLLLTAVLMSDSEQLVLELVNRARANPGAEASRYGISLNEGLGGWHDLQRGQAAAGAEPGLGQCGRGPLPRHARPGLLFARQPRWQRPGGPHSSRRLRRLDVGRKHRLAGFHGVRRSPQPGLRLARQPLQESRAPEEHPEDGLPRGWAGPAGPGSSPARGGTGTPAC